LVTYTFAWGAIDRGWLEAAAAAVICYEWLQRPENVLAGILGWSDYRSKEWPSAIKILHHKTGATVWHVRNEGQIGVRNADKEQTETRK
jgi:hypothetical protein